MESARRFDGIKSMTAMSQETDEEKDID
ncbi:hypothetical protein MY4824_003105, partial [Beauveria thailandica]